MKDMLYTIAVMYAFCAVVLIIAKLCGLDILV